MRRNVISAALAIAALGVMGGGAVAAETDDEREAREQRQLKSRRQREAEEAARHPATQRKPQSESLKRMLGKKGRRA